MGESLEVKHKRCAPSALDPNIEGEKKKSMKSLTWQENPEFLLARFLRCACVGSFESYCMYIYPMVFSRLSQPVFLPLFQEVVALKDHIKLVHCVSCVIGG